MITVWKNDVVRYRGRPWPGLTPDRLYRVLGGDYTNDANEPVIISPADARSGDHQPGSWHVHEADLDLVQVARCHCNFCDGDGDHPECPHNRPGIR